MKRTGSLSPESSESQVNGLLSWFSHSVTKVVLPKPAGAETMVSLIRGQKGFDKQRLFAGTLLVLFLISAGIHVIRSNTNNRNYDYYAITERIKPYIPSGARVMGLPDWWLGFSEYDYRSSLNLTYYHFLNDYSLTEGFEEIRPDILILDEDLQALLVEEGAYRANAGFDIYQLPRGEFEDFLALRGEKVEGFWDPWHGWFDIYAIHWEEELEEQQGVSS